MMWYTMQITLMRHVEKITFVRVVVEFKNASNTITVEI